MQNNFREHCLLSLNKIYTICVYLTITASEPWPLTLSLFPSLWLTFYVCFSQFIPVIVDMSFSLIDLQISLVVFPVFTEEGELRNPMI